MMRSLFAGISGLKNHQTRMDVIGNNIANVNTNGFKRSRVIFQDMVSQMVQCSSPSTEHKGGTNPIQVGLGMSLATIDVVHTRGSLQPTGKNTDLSIEGEGFFMVGEGESTYYTRAGNFDLDHKSKFIHGGTSLYAKGILANAKGEIDPGGNIQDIDLSAQVLAPSHATSEIVFAKNLASNADIQVVREDIAHTSGTATDFQLNLPYNKVVVKDTMGTELDASKFSIDSDGKLTIDSSVDTGDYEISYQRPNYSTSISIYDSLGETHEVNVYYTKLAGNKWAIDTAVDNEFLTGENGKGTLEFDPSTGKQLDPQVIKVTSSVATDADDLAFDLDFTNVCQFAGNFTITYTNQDGYEAGYLEEVIVDNNGVLHGNFSNGQSRALAQLTIATFNNPAGLTKVGNNLYAVSNNSGFPDEGQPGVSGRGNIKPETLEMSNVDLSQEFVDMIITQRGFQANSRVITTSDQILEELVNLRR